MREWHPALQARSAARRTPRQAAPAEIVAAAQDRDRILEEIQADSARGFPLEVSDGVPGGHGCLQEAVEERARKEAWPGAPEAAAGRDAGAGVRSLPSKGNPGRLPHSHPLKHGTAPRATASHGLRTEGNAGSGSGAQE